MTQNTFLLWDNDEYAYPMAFGFIPNLVSYIHSDKNDCARPAVVIVPGGGYSSVSPTEGEIVALEFYNKGYNTFVLTYTTDLSVSAPLKMQPLKDLSRAVRMLRQKAGVFHIDTNRIAICGFSAGGHLCASLAVHHGDVADVNELYSDISNRPDAAILCYPVISSGEKAHRMSFVALLGKDASSNDLEYMSLERHVSKNTPPIFIWHTATDEAVPVENTLLFTEACKAKGITYEQHIFSNGPHGYSLANEKWASGQFGRYYTLEQAFNIVDKAKRGEVEIPSEIIQYFTNIKSGGSFFDINPKPNKSVETWPVLADLWLKGLAEN